MAPESTTHRQRSRRWHGPRRAHLRWLDQASPSETRTFDGIAAQPSRLARLLPRLMLHSDLRYTAYKTIIFNGLQADILAT